MGDYPTGIYNINAHSDGMGIVDGESRIREEYSDYLKDESNTFGSGVEKLFFPENIKHVSYIVREAQKRGKFITISGGRTGICAGAVAEGGWLLSLEKMKRILTLSSKSGSFELKVESGLRLSELVTKVRSRELGIEGSSMERFIESSQTFLYPPDPTETTAMLGGTVATNASGARTFYYGPTRRWVVGMEVVLTSGELLRIRRGEVKENNGYFSIRREGGTPIRLPFPGYTIPETKHSAGLFSKRGMDIIDLFIGSEGILGIIVNVTIVLIPEPVSYIGGVGFFNSEKHAVDFVINARNGDQKPLALEYFDSGSLLLLDETRKIQGPTSEIPEIPYISGISDNTKINVYAVYFESAGWRGEKKDDMNESIKKWQMLIEKSGGDPAVSWGAISKRDLLRLKSFRHSLPETINKIIAQNKRMDPRIHKVGTDMAVPDSHLAEMVDFYRETLDGESLRYVIFGHIGNNHLHVNMIPDSHTELERAKKLYGMFARKAVSLGGTVSAEHGIGKLKREYLALLYTRNEIQMMKTIKHVLDPKGILTPGNMFEPH
ncbi:MAG: FAD-binding oxidoreductase [Spirochaetota bacterium]|nr:MAG: FAD-binding oxidoreductase [Spirochaetota bacterium]